MKSKTISKLVIFLTAILIFSSCSEFLLVPITVEYPFDKDSPSSPSEYEIDIDEGLELVDSIMSKNVSASVVKNEIEGQYADKYPGSQITVNVTDSDLSLENILDVISGKTVTKKIEYSVMISIPGQDDIFEDDVLSLDISICDFYNATQQIDPVFADDGIQMTIKNVSKFCKLSESEKEANVEKCSEPDRNECLHIEARHENTSISIMLAEVKELKDYKQFLDKIYSATLNDITFTILEKPDVPLENNSFYLEAELFAQPVDSFKKDGTKCESSLDEGCVSKGVNYDGEIENYFDDDPDIREKYLVGVFGTSTFSDGELLELVYTYEGKDILQKSIKHLNFQIGAKSYYLFFPGAQRPKGKLTADIKAKLLFNVEPLN